MFRSLFTSVAVLGISASAAADYSLTILHTNDFHAQFEPVSKCDSGCSAENNAEGKCFGALLVWSLLLMLRELGREIRSCLMAAINFKALCFTPVTRVNWPQR